jgi:hypothetical protein
MAMRWTGAALTAGAVVFAVGCVGTDASKQKTPPEQSASATSPAPAPTPATIPARPSQPTRHPQPAPTPAAPRTDTPQPGLRELFPGIRADLAARTVEFDGTVPIDAHDPRAPRVYLEVTVCTPDTKEHEALVVAKVRPSDVHAALLAIGLKPGAPGSWEWKDQKLIALPPSGDPVRITFITTAPDGTKKEEPATDWIVHADTGAPFVAPGAQDAGFLFAGSIMRTRQGQEVYDANGTGTLIGLCTFGAETIAWGRLISPDSETEEPVWIADAAHVPPAGTPVTVRIAPARP